MKAYSLTTLLILLPFLALCSAGNGGTNDTIARRLPPRLQRNNGAKNTHELYPHNFELFTGGTTFEETTLFTIGIDYEYLVNEFFGIGVIIDYELPNSVREGELLITSTLMFFPFPRFKVFAGDGVAMVEGERFYLLRAGISYEIDLADHWFLSPVIQIDHTERDNAFVWGINSGFRF